MIDVVNATFNEKLQRLTPANADSVIFSLGWPSHILLSAGIDDKEFRLYGNKLMKKIKKHGYKPYEIQDLPNAINSPIIVFKGTHAGSYSILTGLKIKGCNVLISLEIGKGTDAIYNIITSIYRKEIDRVICWINSGYLLYVNKNKALGHLRTPALMAGAISNREPLILNYLRTTAPNAGAIDSRELFEAIKTVTGFKNPVLRDKITYSPENVNTQNTFFQKGAKNARP